MTDAAAILPWM